MTAHAEKCPVCASEGTIPAKPCMSDPLAQRPLQCHGCGGMGWVTVADPEELNPVVVSFHPTELLATIET